MTINKYRYYILLSIIWFLLLSGGFANADLTIEITHGRDTTIPIAIIPFVIISETKSQVEDAEKASQPETVAKASQQDSKIEDWAEILTTNLRRSGYFKLIGLDNVLSYPNHQDEVIYKDWQDLGVAYLVFGRIKSNGTKDLVLQWYFFDIVRREIIFEEELQITVSSQRSTANYVSDFIYEKITGLIGIFSTRILYVLVRDEAVSGNKFALKVADFSGARSEVLFESKSPIMSPVWAPDGRRIAYVTFETGRASVIIEDIITGQRQAALDAIEGWSSAPDFSPDGRQLAMVLNRDDNTDIYSLLLKTGELRRITRHYGIDTEPNWAPDGRSIVFTSNRSGSPQIYSYTFVNSQIQRLTFEGDYNAQPQFLPDGNRLVFVRGANQAFRIAALDIKQRRVQFLNEAGSNEGLSIAPNGTMLVYSDLDENKQNNILKMISIDGLVQFRLPSDQGNVREPSWSPYLGLDIEN